MDSTEESKDDKYLEWQGRYGSDFINNEILIYSNKLLNNGDNDDKMHFDLNLCKFITCYLTIRVPSCLIIILGSYSIKWGYSGLNKQTPHIIPTICGRIKRDMIMIGSSPLPFCCGNTMPYNQNYLYDINHPIEKGIINEDKKPKYKKYANKTNWNDIEEFLVSILSKINNNEMDISLHPILIITSNEMIKKKQNLKIQNIITDNFEPPAVALINDSLSSFYSMNEYNNLSSSGIVIDIGSTITTISIIQNGQILYYNKSYVMTASIICDYFQYILLENLPKFGLYDRRKTEIIEFVDKAMQSFYVAIDFEQEILKQIENTNYCFYGDALSAVYQHSVTLKNELFECCEILFHPKFILKDINVSVFDINDKYKKYSWRSLPDIHQIIINQKEEDAKNNNNGYEMIGIVEMLQNCINHCGVDIEIENELFSNILVCGGGSNYNGLKQRLQKELNNITSSNVDITINHNASFVGALAMAESDRFAKRWTIL